MDRQVQWLVFGLVVALVVTTGSIGLALLLPGTAADGRNAGSEDDQAGGPFSWDGERAIDVQGVLAPLWLVLLVAVPLSLLGLVVTGLVWATRAVPSPAGSTRSTCRGCGQELEPGWNVCPYCGDCGERGGNAHDE